LGWEAGPSKDTIEMLYGLDNPVGLAYMAKLLHPEVDIDPREIWNEYQELMGSDYLENRIFVYPED
jgi:iron complex transport system substrate-binding protein